MDKKKKMIKKFILVIWLLIILIITFQLLPGAYQDFLSFDDTTFKYLIIIPPMLMVIWMITAFSMHLFSNATQARVMDNILLEIKKSRTFYFGALLFILTIITIAYYFIFNNSSIPEKFQLKHMDRVVAAIFILLFVICHFLLVTIILNLLKNRSFLMLTKTGMLYEPGGISPGLILWEDMEGVSENKLLYNPGYRMLAPTYTYLIISLKNPAAYYSRYNPLLRTLVNLISKLIKLQANRTGDIIIKPAELGAQYEEVKAIITRNILAHASSNTE